MKNFIFKSNDSDLQKMFQYIESKLEIQSSNILYCTHRIDSILKILNTIQADKGLQKQVDAYFEEDTEHIPEEKQD